jgi:kynurenine formamidase
MSVSCARTVAFAPKPLASEAPIPPVHFMQQSGETADACGHGSAYDWVGFTLHGLYITHLDAPSHIFWKGQMYNGRPGTAVTTAIGATDGGIEHARDGVLSRGILLDVPAARDIEWLEDDDAVHYADLTAAERHAGLHAEAGDVVMVRTGYGARRARAGATATEWKSGGAAMTGLAADCLPWFHERDVAVLATDCGTDASPSPYPGVPAPVHAVAMVAMGIWIVDNCDLEPLATKCQEFDTFAFLLTLSPIRFKNSTGSPVNPIATF